MSAVDITIRRARFNEAHQLTELALRSKASWGYSKEFVNACRAELTFTAAKMAASDVWVAVVDEMIAGMVALKVATDAAKAELEDLFVEPTLQGRRIGAALVAAALDACRLKGAKVLSVDADPNAEGFYQRFGFHTVGRSPSGSIPGRTLPRMQLHLAAPQVG